MNKKIIVLTTFYYPEIQVAAIRLEPIIESFVKNGWEVYVITNSNLNVENKLKEKLVWRIQEPFIKFLLKNRNASSTNVKLRKPGNGRKYKKLLRNLYEIYLSNYWATIVYQKAIKLIEAEDIGYIFATSPGIETIKCASRIKKNKENIKLICEIRDIIAYNGATQQFAFIDKWRRSIERSTFKYIDKYIFLTKNIKEHYDKSFKITDFKIITNGVNLPDANYITKPVEDNISISHIGNLYGSRNPLLFIETLGEILESDQYCRFKNLLTVNFVGKLPQDLDYNMNKLIETYKLVNNIKLFGIVEHSKALDIIHDSDINLLITHTEGSEYAIPGKIFEYIGARKPILALTTDELVKEIVETNKIGWCVNNKSKDEIIHIIKYIFNNYKSIKLIRINEEVLKNYSNEKQYEGLEKFILKQD